MGATNISDLLGERTEEKLERIELFLEVGVLHGLVKIVAMVLFGGRLADTIRGS